MKTKTKITIASICVCAAVLIAGILCFLFGVGYKPKESDFKVEFVSAERAEEGACELKARFTNKSGRILNMLYDGLDGAIITNKATGERFAAISFLTVKQGLVGINFKYEESSLICYKEETGAAQKVNVPAGEYTWTCYYNITVKNQKLTIRAEHDFTLKE